MNNILIKLCINYTLYINYTLIINLSYYPNVSLLLEVSLGESLHESPRKKAKLDGDVKDISINLQVKSIHKSRGYLLYNSLLLLLYF